MRPGEIARRFLARLARMPPFAERADGGAEDAGPRHPRATCAKDVTLRGVDKGIALGHDAAVAAPGR